MHPNTFECLVSASVHLIGQSKSESVGATNPYFSLESEVVMFRCPLPSENERLSLKVWKPYLCTFAKKEKV